MGKYDLLVIGFFLIHLSIFFIENNFLFTKMPNMIKYLLEKKKRVNYVYFYNVVRFSVHRQLCTVNNKYISMCNVVLFHREHCDDCPEVLYKFQPVWGDCARWKDKQGSAQQLWMGKTSRRNPKWEPCQGRHGDQTPLPAGICP